MSKCYYNEVLLPEIPTDVLAEYPYATIFYMSDISANSDGVSVPGYILALFNSDPKLYATTLYDLSYWICAGNDVEYIGYVYYIDNSTTWQDLESGTFSIDGVVSFDGQMDENNYSQLTWTNMDILKDSADSTEIYFAASEPVPYVEEMVLIAKSTIKNSANAIRDMSGTTALINPLDMPGEIRGIKSDSGLGGLENGYDVMFYDENNEALAFYSVKRGHSIEAPIYTCKAWQTEDGANVTFPYAPTADVVLTANNDTLASMLYKYYGIDSAIYPFVCVRYTIYGAVQIFFAKSYEDAGASNQGDTLRNSLTASYSGTISSFTDVNSFLERIMEVIPSGTAFSESGSNTLYDRVEDTYAVNYDTYATISQVYRLDE